MISGTYTANAADTKVFTVAIGATQANNTYQVGLTPGNQLSAGMPRGFFVQNKTTTTFDIIYPLGITGQIQLDWIITP